MRWVLVALLLAGCDSDGEVHDGAVADLAAPDDLSMPDDLSVPPDLTAVEHLPCGEPQMQCCPDNQGGLGHCNPLTATCNPFGVCVECGVYPLACCPGDTCQLNQTCLDDPMIGKFCYPCGRDGEPCCYTGAPCVQPGTSCITPDGGVPICST